MFQTGWGKGFFAQTSDETYSQVLLTSHLLVGKEKFEPHSLLRPKETATNHLQVKGLGSTQDHVPCGLYEKATSVGRNFSHKNICATQPLCSSTRLSQALMN